ncbi:ERI1 exoribonuclease 2 isoform X1 [Anguilla anguilla]|nr:ERI1 exoribonuclease 2 isoform X1 [Anguilla anguilla]
MATKKLANELGLIRKRSRPSSENNEKKRCGQHFSYLIVIDFESTCWGDKNNYGQEIIEFPAVVLNTGNGKIESEFHTYVQPQEHPVLSKFCTELTGIRQAQVEAGVPLHICLSRFTRWIQMLQEENNIVLVQEKVCSNTGHPCAFVTWSDWDLGVCLQYECKRKQICKPDIFNCWIDLRATYKLFYNRKPKGLNGALQDLGITFSGREHSGLDDARNTAHLAWRMITDGCLMKVTRSLDRAPLRTKQLFQMNRPAGNVSERSVAEVGIKKRAVKQPKPGHCENKSIENKGKLDVSSNHESYQYQSFVLPKTLFHGLSTPVVKGKTSAPTPVSQLGSKGSPLSVTAASLPKGSLVLVATTIGCISNAHEADANLNNDPATLPCEWTETPLLIESEESRSYDDVILEDSDTSAAPFMDTFTSQDSNGTQLNTDGSLLNANSSHSKQIVFKNSNTTVYSLGKHRPSSSSSGVFKTPLLSDGTLKGKRIPLSNVSCSAKPKVTCGPEKYCGLNTSTPTRSFTVYKDKDDSCFSTEPRLSSGRLSSVPSLPLSSSVNRTSLHSRGPMKMTSPLCTCGRRAKRMTVGNGGPNHGRVFFSCPIGKMGSGNKTSCGFFKWESSVLKAASRAVASHSLYSIPGTSFASSGKSFCNNSFSPHTNFARRPSLRN